MNHLSKSSVVALAAANQKKDATSQKRNFCVLTKQLILQTRVPGCATPVALSLTSLTDSHSLFTHVYRPEGLEVNTIMAVLSLPLTFNNSFWSQDYRTGIKVLFRKLEQVRHCYRVLDRFLLI